MSNPETHGEVYAPARRQRGRKIFVPGLVAAVVLACVPLVIYVYHSQATAEELAAATAEAERLDPGWRQDEMDAKRKLVADKENGGLRVLDAARLIPAGWAARPAFERLQEMHERGEPEPPELLDARRAAALRAELQRMRPAIRAARRLKDFPQGRYPLHWSDDFVGTLLPHLEHVRNVANLLTYDAWMRAQDGQPEGAWESSQAILNCARSLGDEPLLISVLVRLAVRQLALQAMERTLAQGHLSDAALARRQKLLQDEGSQPLLLVGLRGERAGLDRLMANIEQGKVSQDRLGAFGGKPDLLQPFRDFFTGNTLRHNHAFAVRFLTEAIEIAKQPLHRQDAPLKELEATLGEAPPLAGLVLPACLKVRMAFQRCQAQVRCALTAVAVERYQLAHHNWPKRLADLRPALLEKIPTDPYDGKPLRYRRLADGVVVYSIGPDRVDNGGVIDRVNGVHEGSDLGFRLWDPAKRRQPPKQWGVPAGPPGNAPALGRPRVPPAKPGGGAGQRP
jgi:hypothetical protein